MGLWEAIAAIGEFREVVEERGWTETVVIRVLLGFIQSADAPDGLMEMLPQYARHGVDRIGQPMSDESEG